MKGGIWAGVALLSYFLQAFLLPAWRPWGVVPNLVAIVVIMTAVRLQVSHAIIIALTLGLLLDLISGSDFGLRTAFYSLLALVGASLGRLGVDIDNLGLGLVLLAATTVVFNLVVLADLVLSGQRAGWGFAGSKIFVELILNCLLAILLRPLFNLLPDSREKLGIQGL